MNYSRALRVCMAARGLTQGDVAERSGISSATISAIAARSTKSKPWAATIESVADGLGVSSELFKFLAKEDRQTDPGMEAELFALILGDSYTPSRIKDMGYESADDVVNKMLDGITAGIERINVLLDDGEMVSGCDDCGEEDVEREKAEEPLSPGGGTPSEEESETGGFDEASAPESVYDYEDVDGDPWAV